MHSFQINKKYNYFNYLQVKLQFFFIRDILIPVLCTFPVSLDSQYKTKGTNKWKKKWMIPFQIDILSHRFVDFSLYKKTSYIM